MSHDKDAMPMNKGTMAMHMTFFWSKDVVMLFNGWPNGQLGMYILALAFVFFLAVAVELLAIINPGGGGSPVIGGLIRAGVYGVRMALLYLIMLSVMSYNVGVFVFVVAGHGIGCFLVKYREISRAARKSPTQPV